MKCGKSRNVYHSGIILYGNPFEGVRIARPLAKRDGEPVPYAYG